MAFDVDFILKRFHSSVEFYLQQTTFDSKGALLIYFWKAISSVFAVSSVLSIAHLQTQNTFLYLDRKDI